MNRQATAGLLAALTLLAMPVSAETMYIDDMLKAPLRAGEGLQYRIVHKGLPSGTQVNLLETSDSGYSRVRTGDGQEGWLPTRYLSRQPIAEDRLKRVSSQLEETRSSLSSVREQLSTVTEERDQLANTRDQLENRVSELSAELKRIRSVSENALSLERQNQTLRESNQQLKKEVEVLTAENERLQSKKESDFMMLGALLVGAGVLIAVVVPWLKPARKTDNWV
ncbi:SH3 domain protein [Tamilnaduibacter salinus]|uniref:SH3 domain protein n=2 Tax=Tamilnaduibacter salinus TaxID=1484056 RepID=A0A2U1CV94_9GAMM|nr:TIGR04211 family SH3 domain-containing protein [Tamilnaduibacter salinus]PVY75422.1 SH3 domain protein [Tamilnaduibacter salinus]